MNINPLNYDIILLIIIVFVLLSLIIFKIFILNNLSFKDVFNLIAYKIYFKHKYQSIYTLKKPVNREFEDESLFFKNLNKYIKNITIYKDLNLKDILDTSNSKYLEKIENIKIDYYIINNKNNKKVVVFSNIIRKEIKQILSSKKIYYFHLNDDKDEFKIIYKIKSFFLKKDLTIKK